MTNKPVKQETQALVTYGEWTPEQMEKESTEMSSGNDFWKAPVGTTSVRFLPPKIGWPSPFVIQHQHYIEMPNLDHAIIFCCPLMHDKRTCLACKKADQMESSGNPRDAQVSKKLRPRKRVLANIILGNKESEAKVQIYGFGKSVYDQLKAIRENSEGGGNFLDPHKGFNVLIKRVGTGKDDTEYTLIPARAQTPLLNMGWIDMQTDLRKLVWVPTEDQQVRLFKGEDPKEIRGEAKAERQRAKAEDDDLDGAAPGRTAEDDLFDEEIDVD